MLCKKIFRTYVELSLLKICPKFLGKVTRDKQFREKKKHLYMNQLSVDFFSFKSVIYTNKIWVKVLLIMRIIKAKTNIARLNPTLNPDKIPNSQKDPELRNLTSTSINP